MTTTLHSDLYGWWRILETLGWTKGLDALGPAMLSLTGRGDRLRMHCFLAYVNVKPTLRGASFTWEYDPVRETGSVSLLKGGKLHGRIKIQDGDESTFVAERADEPDEPIHDPQATAISGGDR
jgi:hypothetical protein